MMRETTNCSPPKVSATTEDQMSAALEQRYRNNPDKWRVSGPEVPMGYSCKFSAIGVGVYFYSRDDFEQECVECLGVKVTNPVQVSLWREHYLNRHEKIKQQRIDAVMAALEAL